ncbi:MAG: hypothetical protein IJZ57_06100 [Clostridia bacterium]|nr:hypothetical protein [Clostridia bacterium]
MKKNFMKFVSLFLCLALVFSIGCTGVYATEDAVEETPIVETEEAEKSTMDEFVGYIADPMMWIESLAMLEGAFNGLSSELSFEDNLMKVLYNVLNVVVEKLVQIICKLYPNPNNWQSLADYNSEEVGFMPGRDTYQTSAAEGNYWSLGYASRSVVPEDIDSGDYYLGRDLMNKEALGVYDDMRVRVAVIDDNSGEGAVVVGAIDCLGVTSTDVRSIRKGVMAYCEEEGIEVASINIMATHAHSALDTQGVSTQFFYKLLANGFNNEFEIFDELPFLEAPTYFKEYFVEQSILAVKEAFEDVEKGQLYYSSIYCGDIIEDKRDLISKEDLPEIASLYFVPDSGSEATYIADITCHATSFSASNNLVGSDFIYYLDEYIKETNGGNVVMIPGAVGQVSRDIEVDETGLTEWESKGASAKTLGRAFGKLIVEADYSEKLAPVLNATHREIVIHPENSILVLACEVKLVNNRVYIDEDGNTVMPTEMGYLEFGNRVGLALFPAELYPEVFWGHEITGYTNWDGTEWPYESLATAVDGVDIYAVSLANDALGYVLTDNNFAFMGHIIGEGIADETLSVGKHMGSYIVSEYYAMIDEMK